MPATDPDVSLVTIGIPTYNRAALLSRSLKAALGQDYPRIEVIVADNASTDHTVAVCEAFAHSDSRMRYYTHPHNLGPTANFNHLLQQATGEYFMWLGDDDWIDENYVSQCLAVLEANPEAALASGVPVYYREGVKTRTGTLFNLTDRFWPIRVASYYMNVTDNGLFYGLMRTEQLRPVSLTNQFGGDWHTIASIASQGKCFMLPAVSVHREQGGASNSHQQTARVLGLSQFHAMLPMLTIATGAYKTILFTGNAFKGRSVVIRSALAAVVFCIVASKSLVKTRSLVKKGKGAYHYIRHRKYRRASAPATS